MAELRQHGDAAPLARLEILAYAPTEFFHCHHCEVVWDQVGLGQRVHAEQRASGLLPPDLEQEYAEIGAWVQEAAERYGPRLAIRVVDAASLEGVLKALRYRTRRFPAFIFDGQERIVGFDRGRLDAALARRLSPMGAPAPRAEGG
jgi:hypothetical protein